MISVRKLCKEDLTPEMLMGFRHEQIWTKQWCRMADEWCLESCEKMRTWDLEKRKWIPNYLLAQIENGGYVTGAFDDSQLIGFSCVDGVLSGKLARYVNLTMLFVDDRYQRQGIGKKLFLAAVNATQTIGAEKLFISAIPSEDTIAFYMAMGCEIGRAHV